MESSQAILYLAYLVTNFGLQDFSSESRWNSPFFNRLWMCEISKLISHIHSLLKKGEFQRDSDEKSCNPKFVTK